MVSHRRIVLEFLVLEHGFMGEHRDMEHFGIYTEEECLRWSQQRDAATAQEKKMNHPTPIVSSSSSPTTRRVVVLNHPGNDGVSGICGIAKNAKRLLHFTLTGVEKAVEETLKAEHPDDGATIIVLKFHFVGFSMGGLVIRAVLPPLQSEVERRYSVGRPTPCDGKKSRCGCGCSGGGGGAAAVPQQQQRPLFPFEVVWDCVIFIASPHLGCSYLGRISKLIKFLKTSGLLPASGKDMILANSYVEDVLMSPAHLAAIRRFREKIFIAGVHDTTVWNYSTAFVLPPMERWYLRGGTPSGPVLNADAIPQYVVDVMAPQTPSVHLSDPTTPIDTPHRSSDVALPSPTGLTRVAPERRAVPTTTCRRAASTELRVCETFEPEVRPSTVRWMEFLGEERRADDANASFFASMGIRPASTLEEMQQNGVPVVPSPESGGGAASSWITEESWPQRYLPQERALGLQFLEGVGPIQLHMVDFVPAMETYLDALVRTKKFRTRWHKNSSLAEESVKNIVGMVYQHVHPLHLSPGADYELHDARTARLKACEKAAAKALKVAPPRGGKPFASSAPSNPLQTTSSSAPLCGVEESETLPRPHFDVVSRFVAWKIVWGSTTT